MKQWSSQRPRFCSLSKHCWEINWKKKLSLRWVVFFFLSVSETKNLHYVWHIFHSVWYSLSIGVLPSSVWSLLWYSAADSGVGVFLPAGGVCPCTKFFTGKAAKVNKNRALHWIYIFCFTACSVVAVLLHLKITSTSKKNKILTNDGKKCLFVSELFFSGVLHVWLFLPRLQVSAVCRWSRISEDNFAVSAWAPQVARK